MRIEETNASVHNQPRHVVDRGYRFSEWFLQMSENVLINVERVIADDSVDIISIAVGILFLSPRFPVKWATGDDGFWNCHVRTIV